MNKMIFLLFTKKAAFLRRHILQNRHFCGILLINMSSSPYSMEQVQARWLEPGRLFDLELFISDPDVARFSALFDRGEDGDLQVEFGDLRVHPEHRESGLATRLANALIYLAIDRGAQTLSGSIDSQHSLKILRHMFGDNHLNFSDIDPATQQLVQLPITIDEAIEILERAEKFEIDTEYREKDLIVHADLTAIDASKLEVPVELNSPDDTRAAALKA